MVQQSSFSLLYAPCLMRLLYQKRMQFSYKNPLMSMKSVDISEQIILFDLTHATQHNFRYSI